jgi:hypothetical protein
LSCDHATPTGESNTSAHNNNAFLIAASALIEPEFPLWFQPRFPF